MARSDSSARSAWPSVPFGLWMLVLLWWAGPGCVSESADVPYVARVGEAELTQEDLQASMIEAAIAIDTSLMREQIIERWVENELLVQEARRRGLHQLPEVRRRMEENERSLLISALLDSLYVREADPPSPADLGVYFQSNRDRFRLVEPYLNIFYVTTATAEQAAEAQRALQQLSSVADSARVDSFLDLSRRLGREPDLAARLATAHLPASRFFPVHPALRTALLETAVGATSEVIEERSAFHVLRMENRAPAGALPELDWIEADLRERLDIEERKQIYRRSVQGLRAAAEARNRLEIRP
ncbi:MAG: peptidyl-prolyl cis-trans isomerase [Bacteroidota bacterium]